MKIKQLLFLMTGLVVLVFAAVFAVKKLKPAIYTNVGKPIDSFNGVNVYYNGGVSHMGARNFTADKYNLGIKYQCVEFVKRYYYQHLNHKMPDSYGNAKDFFDKNTKDGEENKKRGLVQYRNPGISVPMVDDLVIFSGTSSNPFGHVAIISKVTNNSIEIIQQNAGPFASSRAVISIEKRANLYRIMNSRILGWLRKE